MSDLDDEMGVGSAWLGGFRGARDKLASFDGGVRCEATVFAPDRYRFFENDDAAMHRIPSGAGLSYAAASFCKEGNTVSHRAFDRILDFDSETGEIDVEPGITLGALFDFLIGRGLYLRSHPGHGAITVGGCIAADVHGKNPVRDGNFVHQVVSLELFHPQNGRLTLSRSQNPELFELTCGGFGLTGHIVSARLKPAKVEGTFVRRRVEKHETFSNLIDALVACQADSDYAYSWHDMARPGVGFGCGYLHSGVIEEGFRAKGVAKSSDQRRAALLRRLPVNGLINYFTTPLLNRAYRSKVRKADQDPKVTLQEAVFPIMGSEAYFALFGRAGFHEAQVLVPIEQASVLSSFLEASVAGEKVAIGLASAKLFDGQSRFLRYAGAGLSLAINVPRNAKSVGFLKELDRVVMSCGGKPNIIKDSRLGRDMVDACYPEADTFRSELMAFDPKRVFQSELSRRLSL